MGSQKARLQSAEARNIIWWDKIVFTHEFARLIADPDHSEYEDTIDYFKGLAEDKGVQYQSLINLYLRDCAQSHKDLTMKWE